MKKITIVLAMFISLISTVFSFDMSTTIFDQRIDNGEGYKEIVFNNKYNENVRYKIKIIKEDEGDMSNWVEVSPKILNIQPLSTKTLKIFAKSPRGTKMGEYSFKLQIEPIIIPTISKTKEGIKGSTNIAFVPIIKMFGHVGDPDFENNINLENISLKKSDKEYILKATLINKSYAGKNIGFNFIGENNFIIDGKWIGRLSSNFKKDITIKIANKFKEISVYDAETNEEIKRIVLDSTKDQIK